MKNMQLYYCLILSVLGIAHGSPYYYREGNHHSEHHKEYSYSNSEPSLSAYESSPQKYIKSSHFTTHVTPHGSYKLETSPSFSIGYSQYSGVKPGTDFIKQVKVYQRPTTYTGFFETSNFDGKGLETGQHQENFYGRRYEDNLNAQTGEHVKQVQTNFYHQVPHTLPTVTQDENLFGQKHISEEDFSQFGQQQINGHKEDSDIGQEHDLRTHHSQIVITPEKIIVDNKNNKGYYERKVITYGSPEKESNAFKKTYVHHTQIHGTTDIEGKDFGKYRDVLLGPTTIKIANGFENIHTGSQQESKHNMYSQEAANLEKKVQSIKPQEYYNNPVFIPQHTHPDRQIYSGSLEKGQHEESQYEQHSVNLGQQLVSGSLELDQKPDSITGQQIETGSFEIGRNEESLNGKQFLTWERHINTSRVEETGSRKGTSQKPIEHHLRTEHLEIRHSTNNKPHINVTENLTRTMLVGYNIPKKPVQNLPEGQEMEPASNQNIKKDFFEIGQKEENMGQLENVNLGIGQHEENIGQFETGILGIGQHEENIGQLETGILGIGQHEENIGQSETGILGIGQREENIGQLETGILGIGQREENIGQSETGILGIGQHEENIGQSETGILGIGQHEENIGQLETGILGIGQHEENMAQSETDVLGIGQHEETLEIGKKLGHKTKLMLDNDKFNSGQMEETSLDFQKSKNTFPSKLTESPYNEHTSFIKTYNQHESHYKELKQTSNNHQKHDSTATRRSNDQENINTNKKTDYLKLQLKAEELAQQLGLEDISKQKSSQQESNEDKFVKKNIGKTFTSGVHSTEISKKYSIANHHAVERESLTPNKKIATWETHKEYSLNYPLSSQELYSKKLTEYQNENQGHFNQPMLQNYGYQRRQYSSHYGGYGQDYPINSKEGAYFSDQPIQRTHTSGSQFSFSSSSGSSQDREKVIGDFLKELDKDIAMTNHQQQGSSTGMTYSRPVNSDVSYYSQRTITSHSNSNYSSGGTKPGGTTGRAWYQRIGDSIGSGYNQAKEKAKEIAKTVKQSVGFSSS